MCNFLGFNPFAGARNYCAHTPWAGIFTDFNLTGKSLLPTSLIAFAVYRACVDKLLEVVGVIASWKAAGTWDLRRQRFLSAVFVSRLSVSTSKLNSFQKCYSQLVSAT